MREDDGREVFIQRLAKGFPRLPRPRPKVCLDAAPAWLHRGCGSGAGCDGIINPVGGFARMELSSTEKKMVARLRRKQEQWPRTRWVLLCIGVGSLGVSGYGLPILLQCLHEKDPNTALVLACFIPQIYLCALLGAWAIGYAWADWNGNSHDRLILRLLDDKLDPKK